MTGNNDLPAPYPRPIVTAFVAWAIFAAPVCAEEDRLVFLDGRSLAAEVVQIDSAGLIHGRKIPADLDLDSLRRIQRPAAAIDQTPAKVVVTLYGGGRIMADRAAIDDEQCRIAWSIGKPLVLPIDAVRAIQFLPRQVEPAFQAALAKPSAEFDRLLIRIDDQVQAIDGLVELLTEENVVFLWQDQQRTLPRDRLFGIVVAQAPAGADQPALLWLTDGSSLPATIVSLQDNVLKLRSAGEASVEVPWQNVVRLDIRSPRMTFLSDLKPIEVKEEPIVTFGHPWQRDLSVMGRPLTVAGRRFDKGIGVHARSRLTFKIAGQYETFAATLGIDDESEGRGDCLFVVLADGSQLYRQRIRAADPPRQVKLDVRGIERLTLLVEPGEDLDLSDHADWCDVRLIRPRK